MEIFHSRNLNNKQEAILDVWGRMGMVASRNQISRYKDIMEQKYITQWRCSVNYTRKLEFYNTFKHCYEISSYFNLTRKTINRKALVKLRVSNHKLMIETRR